MYMEMKKWTWTNGDMEVETLTWRLGLEDMDMEAVSWTSWTQTWTCSMDMDKQHGKVHGSMDMDM
jgi:hypothetical protein